VAVEAGKLTALGEVTARHHDAQAMLALGKTALASVRRCRSASLSARVDSNWRRSAHFELSIP
jgi:hypothetical protein